VIYRKKRFRGRIPGGYFSLEDESTKTRLFGSGFGEYIRLRDEFGVVWKGTAEMADDNVVRYYFRDEKGRAVSGISDRYGIILRDEKGKTWRGIVD
jgi:hypothetical protein